jgi:hypothetical protein
VWGSEFTTKAAALQGDSADFVTRIIFFYCICEVAGGAALSSGTAEYNLEEPSENKFRVGGYFFCAIGRAPRSV